MQRNLYGRLFKYCERAGFSPLENYLTEGLCDLLNRMGEESPQAQSELLKKLFDYTADEIIHFQTQYVIRMPSAGLRIPDIVGCCGNSPALLVEVKVDAAYSRGAGVCDVNTGKEAQERAVADEETQLIAYGKWLNMHHPGAKLALLTHKTLPPSDFLYDPERYGVPINDRRVLYWQDIYDMLSTHTVDKTLYAILAEEFCRFLQDRGVAMKNLTKIELDKLGVFLKNETADAVQNFMNTLREQLKVAAQKIGMRDCSWETERSYQYGGRITGDHALIGWVQISGMSLQIAWGFYFVQGEDTDFPDPFWFQKAFHIEPASGVFLNIVYEKETVFPESQTPHGEDWYPAVAGISTKAPAVAFRAFESFEDTGKISEWFQKKFKESCDSLKK